MKDQRRVPLAALASALLACTTPLVIRAYDGADRAPSEIATLRVWPKSGPLNVGLGCGSEVYTIDGKTLERPGRKCEVLVHLAPGTHTVRISVPEYRGVVSDQSGSVIYRKPWLMVPRAAASLVFNAESGRNYGIEYDDHCPRNFAVRDLEARRTLAERSLHFRCIGDGCRDAACPIGVFPRPIGSTANPGR